MTALKVVGSVSLEKSCVQKSESLQTLEANSSIFLGSLGHYIGVFAYDQLLVTLKMTLCPSLSGQALTESTQGDHGSLT